MNSRCIRFGMASALLTLSLAQVSRAEPIVAGPIVLYSEAIQDITLLAGTALNPGTTNVVIQDVTGYGEITINGDAQVGNTITFNSLSGGAYAGYSSALGVSYVFGNVGTLAGDDFSGSITNIVQNPADPGYATGQASSFQSGDFSLSGASFGFQFTSGPYDGVTLYTDPAAPFSFSSTFDGLPPSAGTVLMNSGPDVLDVDLGGTAVALSSNRRIIILAAPVPEPSALILMGVGAAALLRFARKRRANSR